MFNKADYNERLETSWLGSTFVYLERTGSTNSWLKQLPASELRHGTVVLADEQKAGRGRLRRRWLSEAGKNLTFTIALKPSLRGHTERLTLLSLTAGIGVIRVLRDKFGKGFQLKWPNDIMYGGKKLGGILTETVFNGIRLDRILVGIGLNVFQTRFPDELSEATSLAAEFDNVCSREELLCCLLSGIEKAYIQWYRRDEELISEINASMIGVGRQVRLSVNGTSSSEIIKFLGVDRDGKLHFLTPDFDVKSFSHEQIEIHDAG